MDPRRKSFYPLGSGHDRDNVIEQHGLAYIYVVAALLNEVLPATSIPSHCIVH